MAPCRRLARWEDRLGQAPNGSSRRVDEWQARVAVLEEEIDVTGIHKVRMSVGDLVCLIRGFSVQIIPLMRLTPGGHYEVVGPAHVQGIMQGELWQENMFDEFEFV